MLEFKNRPPTAIEDVALEPGIAGVMLASLDPVVSKAVGQVAGRTLLNSFYQGDRLDLTSTQHQLVIGIGTNLVQQARTNAGYDIAVDFENGIREEITKFLERAV